MRHFCSAAAIVGVMAAASVANARVCGNDNDHGCWVQGGLDGYTINADAVTTATGVVCTLEPGSTNPMTGIVTNEDVLCERPVGTAGRAIVGGGHLNVKIKSIALTNPGIAILGPVTLWALGTDGWLYYMNGDSRFRSGADYFSTFFAYAPSLDTNGNAVTLSQITTDRAADGTAHVFGVSPTRAVYRLSGNRWQLAVTGLSIVYGDSAGVISLMNDPASHSLYIFDRNGFGSIPNIPSNQTLCLSNTSFQYYQAATKPLAMAMTSAYFLSNSSDPTQRLFRADAPSGTWGAWAPYLNMTDGYGTDPMPWSVADGSLFHAYTGGRGTVNGEVFLIGSFARLYEYVP